MEKYLATYPHILMMVSHSQDFLDGTCTNIMHLTPERKLINYKGNYSMFVKTKTELEVLQDKEYVKRKRPPPANTPALLVQSCLPLPLPLPILVQCACNNVPRASKCFPQRSDDNN